MLTIFDTLSNENYVKVEKFDRKTIINFVSNFLYQNLRIFLSFFHFISYFFQTGKSQKLKMYRYNAKYLSHANYFKITQEFSVKEFFFGR